MPRINRGNRLELGGLPARVISGSSPVRNAQRIIQQGGLSTRKVGPTAKPEHLGSDEFSTSATRLVTQAQLHRLIRGNAR